MRPSEIIQEDRTGDTTAGHLTVTMDLQLVIGVCGSGIQALLWVWPKYSAPQSERCVGLNEGDRSGVGSLWGWQSRGTISGVEGQ